MAAEANCQVRLGPRGNKHSAWRGAAGAVDKNCAGTVVLRLAGHLLARPAHQETSSRPLRGRGLGPAPGSADQTQIVNFRRPGYVIVLMAAPGDRDRMWLLGARGPAEAADVPLT